MRKGIFSCLIFILLVAFVNCNIWDNIYSQSYADSPIILQESLSLDFKIKQYQLDAALDYNADLQLLTIVTYFDMYLIRLEVLKLQLDLSSLILTAIQAGKNGCQRFKLAALSDVKLQVGKVSKERLFIVNALFKYIGKNHDNGKKWDKYKLQPFLFSSPQTQLGRIKQQVQKNVAEDEISQEIDQLDDLDIDLLLYISVDPNTGKVQQITQGKSNQNVPFQLKSKVTHATACLEEVKILTNQDLKKMAQFIVKNRGNYDKLIDQNLP